MSQERRTGTTRGWVVGRAAGAPVVVSPGWLLGAVVLTAIGAPAVRVFEPRLGGEAYLVAAVAVLLLFGSVFLHELAHAAMARRRGVRVNEIAVTLLGGHTQFGAAAPTPATSALVAVVGPVANLAIAGVAWAALQVLQVHGLARLLIGSLALVNAFVGVFNLVPGLPLDGGRVLEAAVWSWTGRRATGTVLAGWIGRVVAVGVVCWAVLPPLLAGTSPDLTRVVWAALIGAFLWSGAAGSVRAARSQQAVDDVVVARLMTPAVGFPAGGNLGDLERAGILGDVVLLASDGSPVGYVDPAALAAVPPTARAATPLSAVAVGLPPDAWVDVALTGADAVRAVAGVARSAPVMAVVDTRSVVGLLRAQDVISALRTR